MFICTQCGKCVSCCVDSCGDRPGRLVSFGSRDYELIYRGQLAQQLKQK